MKSLPYEKTVVIEAKVQLADLLTRSFVLKNSVAAPIPVGDAYNQGDMTATVDAPLLIQRANTLLIVSSMEDFLVSIQAPTDRISLHCRGLFIHNGAIDNVTISPASNRPNVRLQYIWS